MITRIVKLNIAKSNIDEFQLVFENSKPVIQTFEGCHSVELFKDIDDPGLFFTYSLWETPDHLEAYRNSDFFRTTWRKTRQLFSTPAEAWSLRKLKKE